MWIILDQADIYREYFTAGFFLLGWWIFLVGIGAIIRRGVRLWS